MPIFEILDREMQRVKSRAPASYKAQVLDTEKRVNLLFDHLNSSTLKQDVLDGMQNVADGLSKRDHDTAAAKVTGLMKIVDDGAPWLVSPIFISHMMDQSNIIQIGVKRLVGMSKATPVHS
jgi:protein transport protein SEC31